jgi:hypothetical protein
MHGEFKTPSRTTSRAEGNRTTPTRSSFAIDSGSTLTPHFVHALRNYPNGKKLRSRKDWGKNAASAYLPWFP